MGSDGGVQFFLEGDRFERGTPLCLEALPFHWPGQSTLHQRMTTATKGFRKLRGSHDSGPLNMRFLPKLEDFARFRAHLQFLF